MIYGLIGLTVFAGLLILAAGIEAQQQSPSWGGYFLDNGTHYLLYEGPQPRPRPRPKPKPAPLKFQLHPKFTNISRNPFINALDTPNEFPNRIVNGHRAKCTDCPWLCSVHYENYFICGCVLVSKWWCLTAHHCIIGQAGKYEIRCGSNQQRRYGELRQVQLIVANKGYNSYTMTHDLAMMKFKQPMKFKKCVQKVRLPAPSSTPLPKTFEIWGWGITSVNAANAQRYALTAEVNRVGRKQCRKDYKGQATITEDMICASRKGTDSCSGDSGGPLTHNGILYGLVSWGIGCAHKNYPGVYCSVRYFIKWILSVIANF